MAKINVHTMQHNHKKHNQASNNNTQAKNQTEI